MNLQTTEVAGIRFSIGDRMEWATEDQDWQGGEILALRQDEFGITADVGSPGSYEAVPISLALRSPQEFKKALRKWSLDWHRHNRDAKQKMQWAGLLAHYALAGKSPYGVLIHKDTHFLLDGEILPTLPSEE